ncbi:MAG: CBS domain-containing protein [Geminicoccaceae bacterium]
MTSRGICGCSPASSVRDAILVMAERDCGCVLVTEAGRLVGIFTEGDALKRVVAGGLDPDRSRLCDVMTRDPDTIGPHESVDEVIRRMDEFGYRHLPVLEAGRIVGVLSLRDCSIEDLAAMHGELEYRRAFAERAW